MIGTYRSLLAKARSKAEDYGKLYGRKEVADAIRSVDEARQVWREIRSIEKAVREGEI